LVLSTEYSEYVVLVGVKNQVPGTLESTTALPGAVSGPHAWHVSYSHSTSVSFVPLCNNRHYFYGPLSSMWCCRPSAEKMEKALQIGHSEICRS